MGVLHVLVLVSFLGWCLGYQGGNIPDTHVINAPRAVSKVTLSDPPKLEKCGDGICDPLHENCLTCPQDCKSCSIKGWKVVYHTINQSSKANVLLYAKGHKEPHLQISSKLSPLSATYTTYFNVSSSAKYEFSFHASNNFAGKVTIDDVEVAVFQVGLTDDDSEWVISKVLSDKYPHKIEISGSTTGNEHILDVQWRPKQPEAVFAPLTDSFYSVGICGDGLCNGDENNANCPADCPLCGDGQCTHQENLQSCFKDCASAFPYSKYGSLPHKLAEGDSPPVCNTTYLPGFLPTTSDTLGYLIDNQMLYFLPGLVHMLHGIDIVTAKEEVLPLFMATYEDCPTSAKIIQDTYRGNWYKIPEEYEADPYPMCTYQMDSSFYESSSSLAESMSSETDVSASLGAGYSGFGFSVAAKLAFSYESSVESARSQQSKNSGTLIHTEASCLTSRVQLRKANFHPAFLAALQACLTRTTLKPECMADVIELYGTHYYRLAELGGKLSQVVSIATSFTSTSDSTSLSTAAQASFSASASGWGVSAEASASYSQRQGQDVEKQSNFENASNKSFIITYGGAPGSFGPSTVSDGTSPANWGQWAQTIDLLPVPVKPKMDRIYNLLVNQEFGTDLASLWQQGEEIYFTRYADSFRDDTYLLLNEYTIYAFTSASQPEVVGPFFFSLTGAFGTTPVTPLIQDNIFDINNVVLGTWNLYTFKPGTMTFIDVILQDVGNINALNLFGLFNATHGSTSGPYIGTWKPDMIWIVDKSRSQVYYFNDFSSFDPDKDYATVLPTPRSNVIDLMFFAGPAGRPTTVFGVITLIGTNNTLRNYIMTERAPFTPRYTYDSQQLGNSENVNVYILTYENPPLIGRVLYVRGQMAYNGDPLGSPAYSIDHMHINYYHNRADALGNHTDVYSNHIANQFSGIKPLVVPVHSSVPHINRYCLAYPNDKKCKNPLEESSPSLAVDSHIKNAKASFQPKAVQREVKP